VYCAVAWSNKVGVIQVADDLADQVRAAGPGDWPDFAILLATAGYADHLEDLYIALSSRLEAQVWLCCAVESAFAGDIEFDGTGGVVLWTASLPGATVRGFASQAGPLAQALSAGSSPLSKVLGLPAEPVDTVLLLSAVPEDITVRLLRGLEGFCPGSRFVGATLEQAEPRARRRLLIDGQPLSSGVIGLTLDGPVRLDDFVLLRCRPVGPAMPVTAARGGSVLELAGQPAYEQMASATGIADPTTVEGGLWAGIAPPGRAGALRYEDFLIRRVLAGDPQGGWVSLECQVGEGAMLQFFVYDEAAYEDAVRGVAEFCRAGTFGPQVAGAMLFGYGQAGRAGGAAKILRKHFGSIPVAGLYSTGPVASVLGRPALLEMADLLVLFRGRA